MSRSTPADLASKLNQRLPRRLTRGMARTAAWLAVHQSSRIPHALARRLQGLVHRAPPIKVYSGAGKPRVLFVSHDLTRSGAPQVLAEMALLLRHSYDVTIVSAVDGPWREPLVAAGVPVIVDAAVLRPGSALLQHLSRAVDIAIGNTMEAAGAVATLAPSVPTIWYLHEGQALKKRIEHEPRFRDALALPAAVWVVSRAGQESLLPFRPDAQVLVLGVSPIADSPVPDIRQKPERLRVGVFGSIESRKGQDLLLEALRLCDDETRSQLEFIIHGRVLDAGFKADVVKQAANLSEVSVAGALDQAEYANALLSCDAVMIPSRDEPLSIVACDALGTGRVVLCSRAVGIADYLQDGVNGFVADSAEPAMLAVLLQRAVARRADWSGIGEAGKAVFATNFSLEVFRSRLEGELSALVERPNGTDRRLQAGKDTL